MTVHDRAIDPAAATSDDVERDWLSFEHGGDTYLFDLGFLLSPWTCIFGAGCKGVLDHDATELGHGCCTHGAHFADQADRDRVVGHAEQLSAEQWQLGDLARELGGPVQRNEDGEWTTRVHDGACIFLNRSDFALGTGCALHVGAMDADESVVDWKPEVCWQLPLRLVHHTDEVEHTTWTLREWKRRDWGEGGAEFHWWCTESDDAFVGTEPVVVSLKDEICGLVGDEVYDQLLALLARRPTTTWLPHPAIRRG